MRIAIVRNQLEQTLATEDWFTRSNGNGNAEQASLHKTAEFDVLSEVEFIRASLAQAGHELVIFSAADAFGLCEFLEKHRPELVFNCCEGFVGKAALEMNVAALYELLHVPYTGSPALTLGLLLNKPLAKAVLGAHGIKTPAYVVADKGQDLVAANRLSFPLIVKPAAEDASIGIDDGAVVHCEAALAERVRFVWREFCQPALVEEFIAGREFSASVLAVSPSDFAVLAIGEIAYDRLPPGRPKILGYDAKWNPAAPFTQAMAARCPAAIDDKTLGRIRRVVLNVARTVGLRDYGRVDLRIREDDQTVFVLEVNPNPDLNNECVFMQAARASGRTNESTICEIVARAIERYQARTNVVELAGGVNHERRPNPSQTPSRAHPRAEGRRRASSLPLREELLDVQLSGQVLSLRR
jgi:D-alanine-D-alanine ligase